MDEKLKIMSQSGGFTGWIEADNGRLVQIISPTASREQVVATFALYMAEPDYVSRLNSAWAVQGLTFNNLNQI